MAAGLCRATASSRVRWPMPTPFGLRNSDVARRLGHPGAAPAGAACRRAGPVACAAAWPPPRARSRGGAGQPRRAGRPAALPAGRASSRSATLSPAAEVDGGIPEERSEGGRQHQQRRRGQGLDQARGDERSPARVGGKHVGMQGRCRNPAGRPARGRTGASPAGRRGCPRARAIAASASATRIRRPRGRLPAAPRSAGMAPAPPRQCRPIRGGRLAPARRPAAGSPAARCRTPARDRRPRHRGGHQRVGGDEVRRAARRRPRPAARVRRDRTGARRSAAVSRAGPARSWHRVARTGSCRGLTLQHGATW